MRPYHGFIISIFLTAFAIPISAATPPNECRKLDVTVEVTHTQGNSLGSVTVKTAHPEVEVTLHLLSRGHEQLKVQGGTIRNVPAGNYELVIHASDGAYCSETRKVTIN